jgi:uncharacterized protein
MRFLIRVLGLQLMGAATTLAAQSGSGATAPPQIVVSATGEVRLAPDRATMSFSVETRGQTATAAASENARRQKAVMEALRAKAGAQDQLSTSGYMVAADEHFDAGQRKVVGYISRNTVILETRLIDRIGGFIDTALSAGSNLMSGLRFYASSVDEARRGALGDAVRRAHADAEAMARAASGSLGGLLELTTSAPRGPVIGDVSMAMIRSAAPETPIVPGDLTISVQVSARWLFVAIPQR